MYDEQYNCGTEPWLYGNWKFTREIKSLRIACATFRNKRDKTLYQLKAQSRMFWLLKKNNFSAKVDFVSSSTSCCLLFLRLNFIQKIQKKKNFVFNFRGDSMEWIIKAEEMQISHFNIKYFYWPHSKQIYRSIPFFADLQLSP